MLAVTCKHDHYVSVLYHRNCDLIKALSSALGQSNYMAVQQSKECAPSTSTPQQISISEQRENVAHDLNDHIHRGAKTLIASFQNSPEKYAKLDINTLSEKVDPTPLQFIQLVTQSVRSKRCKLFQIESEIGHTKPYASCTSSACFYSAAIPSAQCPSTQSLQKQFCAVEVH